VRWPGTPNADARGRGRPSRTGGGGLRCGRVERLVRVVFVAAKVWCPVLVIDSGRAGTRTPISVGRVEIYAFSAVFWTSNGPAKESMAVLPDFIEAQKRRPWTTAVR